MGIIATLLPAAQLQRLRVAARDRHELVACDDWTSLIRACERRPVRVAIVDLFSGEDSSSERIRQLKQRLPRLALIGYVAVSVERARDLFDAGRQGMDGLVIMDRDDAPMDLLRSIAFAESRALSD